MAYDETETATDKNEPMGKYARQESPAEEKEEMSKGEEVRFKPPKDFKPPETGEKEWDMVCTFRTKKDGTVCMTKLGDTKMPYPEDEEEEKGEKPEQKEKPDYSSYAQPIMSAMAEGGGNPGGGAAY